MQKRYFINLFLLILVLFNTRAGSSCLMNLLCKPKKPQAKSEKQSKKLKDEKNDSNEKIQAVNQQLSNLKDNVSWKRQKAIIKQAVISGIHPDTLKCRGDKNTPLYEAVLHNDPTDVAFAEFLLAHGANANAKNFLEDRVLYAVKTVAMADLLFQYGAGQTIQTHGSECLQAVINNSAEPALIPWYVSHGVDVNKADSGGFPPLHRLIGSREYDKQHIVLAQAQYLMNAGALLSTRVAAKWLFYGFTAPQLISWRLCERAKKLTPQDGLKKDEEYKLLSSLNGVMVHASNYRRVGPTNDLLRYFPPALVRLMVQYYIEPSYEELVSQ